MVVVYFRALVLHTLFFLLLLRIFSIGGFSGVYTPDTGGSKSAEDFAASFLVSKQRFLDSYDAIHKATNMAGVSFAVVRKKSRSAETANYQTLMSRDYLDLAVEHLSTTSNFIPNYDDSIFRIYDERIVSTSLALQHIALAQKSHETERRQKETLALLVYSSISFSRVGSSPSLQSQIRKGFFTATFWSVYRYFPHIVVFVASDHDRQFIEDMQLPAWRVTQLEVPLNEKKQTVLLPRMSLEHAIHMLQTAPTDEWQDFNYVYFSEGDQILHMRHAGSLFDAIDNSDGSFLLVPHRMQVLLLYTTSHHCLPNCIPLHTTT